MSNTTTQTNVSMGAPSLEFWLTRLGSSWAIDSSYLFLMMPIGLFGVLANFASIYIFSDKQFNTPLYVYLRVYCVTSGIICLACTFMFVAHARKYFDFVNSYAAMVYRCYIFVPVMNTGYYYATVLDVFIMFDRIASLSGKLKWFAAASPNVISLVSFIFCFLTNLPYFWTFIPLSMDVVLDTNQTVHLNFWGGSSSYATSIAGMVIAYVQIALRDIILVALEIVASVVSIILLKSHLNKKSNLLKKVTHTEKSTMGSMNTMTNVTGNSVSTKENRENREKKNENKLKKVDRKARVP